MRVRPKRREGVVEAGGVAEVSSGSAKWICVC